MDRIVFVTDDPAVDNAWRLRRAMRELVAQEIVYRPTIYFSESNLLKRIERDVREILGRGEVEVYTAIEAKFTEEYSLARQALLERGEEGVRALEELMSPLEEFATKNKLVYKVYNNK